MRSSTQHGRCGRLRRRSLRPDGGRPCRARRGGRGRAPCCRGSRVRMGVVAEHLVRDAEHPFVDSACRRRRSSSRPDDPSADKTVERRTGRGARRSRITPTDRRERLASERPGGGSPRHRRRSLASGARTALHPRAAPACTSSRRGMCSALGAAGRRPRWILNALQAASRLAANAQRRASTAQTHAWMNGESATSWDAFDWTATAPISVGSWPHSSRAAAASARRSSERASRRAMPAQTNASGTRTSTAARAPRPAGPAPRNAAG